MNKLPRLKAGLFIGICILLSGCEKQSQPESKTQSPTKSKMVNTCTGTYPSYWQDPAFPQMWQGQLISDAPPKDWKGPIFKLSDKYPRQPVDDKANQPWRTSKFDLLFDPNIDKVTKDALGKEYSWLVLSYIMAGNTNRPGQTDWDICENPIRPWFHIPFQTYDAMSGREFTHGLTREAPVTYSIKGSETLDKSTMWAVGVYNATAAYTLGEVWQTDGTARVPVSDMAFKDGAVIGKPLFNTSSPEKLPVLANMPTWNANISDPAFCSCTPSPGSSECTLVEESQQCPRSTTKWGDVRLLQFDFAVKDNRAPGTQWVYGTFVADGQRKAHIKDPWQRISLLGVMWGNDTPPKGQLAYNYPEDPRKNGFAEEVIVWDTVDELNRYGGSDPTKWMGHLGCNNRLDGPADDANSSCMSCHGSASVPDENIVTPPLLSQFLSPLTFQCVTPDANDPNKGHDRSGRPATVNDKISFAAMDSIYFANVPAGKPFNMVTDNTDGQPTNVMGAGVPSYAHSARKDWISLDYSLQMSISLTQWMQWQQHKKIAAPKRVHAFEIRRNKKLKP
ncbi:hypothetical protein [Aliikangiella coralliicola]|uniref:Uncharacterized protein n=1 Tax=Aliikangiella coralliicola TaxID=2592383 RepID=A0A545UEF7_9GAMM|nr:hypothetical protein [Aliikangiella coralliicola]TQV87815.1 hypothetical protein FLL46_10550 [Aliikangiella coralliicola]